jgi:hypothetical protein
MNGKFEGAWADIRQRLRPGTLVRNWSADRGDTGGEFRINDVDGAAVIVRSGQMGQERRVSKGDFERLFAFWGAYNRGTIGRGELGKRSQNTTYILSILHWREEAQSSTVPARRTASAITPPQPEAISAAPGLAGHDEYGKRVLRAATGLAALYGPTVEIDYGAGQPARIDATVGDIAVEIESRVSKQVRGAVLDLICHPHPKKLLVLLPVHMTNPGVTAEQCRNILNRFCSNDCYRVLVLKGSGSNPQLIDDTAAVAAALADLGSPSPVLTG